MIRTFRTLFTPALVLFAALTAGQARADYSVALSNLSLTTFSGGGTTFSFSIPATPQGGSDGFAQSFNVINVAEPTAAGAGAGSATLSELVTITGSNGTSGSFTGTLSGTFTITGATSSFTGSIINSSGTGFAISNITYALPSPNSQNGSLTSGNISFIVTPTAVPEPASIAMLGLGLVGAGFAARRRLA